MRGECWANTHKLVLAGSSYRGISDAGLVLWGSYCIVQSNVASVILSFRRKQFNSAEIHVFFILIGGATLLIASRTSCLATVVNFGRNNGSKALCIARH